MALRVWFLSPQASCVGWRALSASLRLTKRVLSSKGQVCWDLNLIQASLSLHGEGLAECPTCGPGSAQTTSHVFAKRARSRRRSVQRSSLEGGQALEGWLPGMSGDLEFELDVHVHGSCRGLSMSSCFGFRFESKSKSARPAFLLPRARRVSCASRPP